MRITNTIMSNNMLSSINKNMHTLNKKYLQMGTGKKIQMASEDPIIASRALRYRSIVSSTKQYITNCNQANSWMSVTESAMDNITSILEKMRDNSILGATDSYEVNDRKKLLNEFNSYVSQLEDELNATCMGRYVFSGYKTNTPVIKKDEATGENILNPEIYNEKVTEEDKLDKMLEYVNNLIVDASAQMNAVGKPAIIELNQITNGGVEVVMKNGNYVLQTTDGVALAEGNKVYAIERRQVTDNSYTICRKEDGVSVNLDFNYGFFDEMFPEFSGSNNTEVGGHDIELQIGVGNLININLLAPDIYDQDTFESFHEFKELYNYMLSDEYSNLDSSDIASFDEKLREKYEHMIAKISDYGSVVSEQHANLGTRMSRLELTKSRLEDDEVNYSSIMSDNEGISLAEATMNYNVANTSYEASLRVGMLITRLTLADYI